MLIGGCNNTDSRPKPTITVSIEPQRWLLERIVGDRMEVNTLIANGANPESYEPSFAHLANLERSVCFMQIGNLAFETSLTDKISANNPGLKIVDTSAGIRLITGDHGHDHGIDPHVWNSARNARIIARNMLNAIIDIDPEGADSYRSNFSRLCASIDSVDSICSTLLAPHGSASFMVVHPSLSYFARDYGLHQLPVGTEGKEHSVADARRALDEANEHNARVFLVDKDFNEANAAVIAGSGIKTATINPLNYEWDTELTQTARAIAAE